MQTPAAYDLDVRIAYVDANGVRTGAAIGVLNTIKLLVTVQEPDRQVQVSYKRDSRGQALAEKFVAKPTLLQLSIDDTGDAEVLAWALNGEVVGFAQSSATVTAEEQTAVLGQWVQLANRALSSVVVKDNATSAITYVAGTDYLVDLVSGQLMAITGGAITDGEVLKIAYSAAALTGKKIKVGTRPAIYVNIDGEGVDTDGNPVHVVVRRASLSASGDQDLVSGKFVVSEMKGTAFIVGNNPAVDITLIDPAG